MLFWTGMKMHEKRRYEATDMRRITEALKQNNQTTTSNFPCNFNFTVSNMNRFN